MFFLKIEVIVIIRFLFFYSIKIGNLVDIERKKTERGLAQLTDLLLVPPQADSRVCCGSFYDNLR